MAFPIIFTGDGVFAGLDYNTLLTEAGLA